MKKRRRLFNDNFDDHFEDEHPDEHLQEHIETPQEREEREIKEVTIERRSHSVKIVLVLIIVAVVLFLGWWVRQHYFSPYRVSQEKGWIMKVSNEGTLFKTFEGEMISVNYIEGDIEAMHSDFKFSITSDSVARQAMKWQGNGQRVILTYNEYKGTVAWRGGSRRVVTKIERDSDNSRPNPYPDGAAEKPAEK